MTNRRGILFLALAATLGIVAFLVAQRFLEGQAPPDRERAATVPVVVARTDMAVATTLQPLQLQTFRWPKEHVPPGAIHDVDEAAGRVLRRPVASGEPILEPALFEQGAEGGLAAVISSKHRAVSVKVDHVIGVAGFVKPGARVDVLATLRRVDQQNALPYSKVILQDVRVLAIDQQLEAVDDGDAEPVNVVTLEVSPEHAEQLIYAAHEGRLQLAMRTPGDAQVVATTSIGVADLFSDGARSRNHQPAARRGPSVEVLRGSQIEVQRF